MKKYIIFFGIWVVSCSLFSNNLIPNPSFEAGQAGYPNSQGQVDRSDEWKNFKTSDWYSTSLFNGTYETGGASFPMQAHTGTHYLGFGSCEGAQVKLTNTVEPGQFVQVSFWWSPFQEQDTEINIYLLKNKANSLTALSDCQNPNISFEYNEVIEVNAGGADAIHIPGQWYHYVSEEFLLVDDTYDWIAVKGKNVSGVFGDPKYIYVDDFTLTATHFCDHPCIEDLGFIETSGLPSAMYTSNPDIFGVVNATNIEFQVFNQWGNLVYDYDSFDPHGLVNTTVVDPVTGDSFSYFALRWQATDNAGNYLILNDTYVYTISVWNCEERFDFSGRSITIFPDGPASPQLFPEVHNREAPECCIEDWFYQNISLTGIEIREVAIFIEAGKNVTSGTQGPVIVENGASVLFDAGEEVRLKPGFWAKTGASFTARTLYYCDINCLPCRTHFTGRIANAMDLASQYPEITTDDFGELADVHIDIYPNPNSGRFTLSLNGSSSSTISYTITDAAGKQIQARTGIQVSGYTQLIDISSHPKGMYWLKVTDGLRTSLHKINYQ